MTRARSRYFKSSVTSSADDLPERMLRAGRAVVPTFAVDEPLYYRITKNDVIADRLDPLAIHLPGCSVNRGGPGFGPAEDVLRPSYPDHGIARFIAGDLPSTYVSTKGAVEYKVEHLPEDDNYAHSEIRIYWKGKLFRKYRDRLRADEVLALRARLAEKATILAAPKV